MEPIATEESAWFAMRATYSRNLYAQQRLRELAPSIEAFIPMRQVIRTRNARKVREAVPVIRDLIFVHACPTELQRVKREIPYLIYITEPRDERNIPVTVPEEEMRRFIAVTRRADEHVTFWTPDEIDPTRDGTKVRIHGGVFDGLEGVLKKVAGFRSKRVVIAIRNIIAAALGDIRADLLEVIDDTPAAKGPKKPAAKQ